MSEKLKVAGRGGAPPCTCNRQGGTAKAVQIGGHTIWAGGGQYLSKAQLHKFDHQVDLRAERLPEGVEFGDQVENILYLPIRDFSTIPEQDIKMFGKRMLRISRWMKAGEQTVIYCAGGHGRTGLVLGWLLTQLEPMTEDPVAEIRRRYCSHAVETKDQRAQVARWSETAKAVCTAINSEGETT